MYSDGSGQSLYCYQVTATVESITISEYQSFIGDTDGDGVPFDTLNLESYSGGDIFVLIMFLSFVCCGCWCFGWYAHKRKFKKDLERELQQAANFAATGREDEINKQLMANSQPDMFEKGISRFTNR